MRIAKPGSRVVSHVFDMGDWAPDDTIAVEKLVPDGTNKELSGPSIALTRLSSRGENPTTSVPGAAIDTHGNDEESRS